MKTNNSFARVGLLALAALLLLASGVLAQAPTGDVTGRVMADGKSLPGVTVTATSPSLQGSSRRRDRRQWCLQAGLPARR